MGDSLDNAKVVFKNKLVLIGWGATNMNIMELNYYDFLLFYAVLA